MKTVAPDYYKDFHCIADKCAHTCCKGWEIDVDEISAARFSKIPAIAEKVDSAAETPHIKLLDDETCPFLLESGLCSMIIDYGEDMLCDICRDHPRFRNFWSDRTEIGLGMVCEEAAGLILSQKTPMKLVTLYDDGGDEKMSSDEEWLTSYISELLNEVTETGPSARLLEYLIYRHMPDALYDDMLTERLAFIRSSHKKIISDWQKTDGSIASLAEICRRFSYDVEYDDDVLKEMIENSANA